MSIRRNNWEKSYKRGENFIFSPNEEVVKFLNRFVRKRCGFADFKDILDFSKKIRGLDFGCGIGAQVILMKEFGIDAYGLDISRHAIEAAKELAVFGGYPDLTGNFAVTNGHKINFPDKYFDITLSSAVLDSMPFELAVKIMKEFDRVTKNYVFLSLIGGDDSCHFREFSGEELVSTQHEKGTIQSYFNWQKIQGLISQTRFSIVWAHLVTEESLLSHYRYGRYYIVLKKQGKN